MPIEELVVHGAREHNLKDVTVRLPRNALICITGLSGSGKSSLAFDTIYAEGQRRYVESLSAYARQFLQMMEKPDVDSIDGLSPAISIDQKTTSRNPRSTVGTVTEIYDYLRLLYARVGRPHCPVCGRPIAGQSLDQIVEQMLALPEGTRFTVNAPIVRDRKGEFRDVLEELRRDGFTRVKVDGEQRLLEEEIVLDKKFKHTIEVVVDRLVLKDDLRQRLTQSVETATSLAEGLVGIDVVDGGELCSTPRTSPAPSTASRCPSSSRASSPSTRRTGPARAAPASARSSRSTRTCSSPTRRSRSPTARSCRGRSAARASTRASIQAIADRYEIDTDTAVARPDRGAAGLVPLRHERRPDPRPVQEPDGPQAPVRDGVRGDPAQPRAPLPRDRLVPAARADRGVHELPALPRVQRRPAQARGARRHGRRNARSTSSRASR